MLGQEKLSEVLKQIAENNYEIPSGYDLMDLTEEMLNHIGNNDSELRDKLIYTTFYYWIVDRKYYTEEQLRSILTTSLDDNHLFYHIGASNDDSVFTRAFSVLIIPLILARNSGEQFLNNKELEDIKEKVIAYLLKEKDYRGYVEDTGWAHAIAHGADALDELAHHEGFNSKDLMEILEVIKSKMSVDNYVYVNEEDERMTTAVIQVLKRKILSEQEIIEWIKSFETLEKPEIHPNYHNFIINRKSFLRSIYFRIYQVKEMTIYQEAISVTLNKLNRFLGTA